MANDTDQKMLALSAKVQAKLDEISKKMGGGSVSIGFMEGATYPDGTPVAEVAFFNEFGVPNKNQPPRPFFRNMIEDHQDEWPAQMAAQAKGTNYDGPKVLGLMGELIKGELQQSINDLTEPALAASTIARKGFDKPLIDTSHLLNSITYKVE
jgi:hypothetical protein